MFLLIVMSLLLVGCDDRKPIKIGFLGVLTGRSGDIGTAGRDGALLAVEEINETGGIDGRLVELVVRDDKQDPEACSKAVKELIEEQVLAIVGPMTSAMAMVAVPIINEHSIPTVSPTVSTAQLSGLDDFFFRVIPANISVSKEAAKYMYSVRNCRSIQVVYDESNKAFTEPWYQTLKEQLDLLPGTNVIGIPYFSRNGYDFLTMVRSILKRNSDCLVILANALDTALISQQLAKLQADMMVLVSEWSVTEELFEYGGSAVDGFEFFHSFNRNSTVESYRQFDRRFLDRFGYSTNFASSYGYNAMKIILGALKNGPAPEKIKRNILESSPYEGVQSQIYLDRFGDAEREYTLFRVEGGKVISIKEHAQN